MTDGDRSVRKCLSKRQLQSQPRRRRGKSLPEPLSEAAAAHVEQLLREGLSAVDVSRRLIKKWPLLTPARVRMEAYRLGIGLPQGRRIGTRMPGVGGRPRGPGKKFSPNRARAQELRQHGYSLRAIADLISVESGVSITAEGVRKLLLVDVATK